MERKYRFIYDEKQKEQVQNKLTPLIEELINSSETYNLSEIDSFEENEALLFYLSDEQLKKLVPKLSKSKALVSILPHPEARDACIGWGIDFKLENAVKKIKENPDPIVIDILYCNERPVFNNIVIGYAFQLTTSNYSRSLSLASRLKNLFRQFLSLHPFKISVHLKDNKVLKTAVAGVVVVQHRKSSLVSRLILEDSSISDGMFHAFLFSPRSLMNLIGFFFRSLGKKKRIPAFGAHIKTNKITFETNRTAFDFALDGSTLSAKNIELRIEKKQFSILPGTYLAVSKDTKEPNEIYKTEALPKGEAADALCESSLPIIKRASTEEFRELFHILRENANLKNSFLVLMVLSTILATFGLFADSGPVVIGAMILAPLMAPIISVSMATLRQDRKLFIDALQTILAGLGLSILFAIGITLITPIYIPNSEILARIRPNLLDLGIAVISGVAGAYAHAREEVAKTLAGVAIAVALVPPLAVAGIGLGWLDMEIFLGAGLLLLTNLVGMILAAAITFMILGFSPLKLAFKGVIVSFITVIILCIPLAFGFNRMVQEHNIIEKLNNWETENVILKDISVQRMNPLEISLKIVSDKGLNDQQLTNIKKEVEQKIGQEATLEITLATKK